MTATVFDQEVDVAFESTVLNWNSQPIQRDVFVVEFAKGFGYQPVTLPDIHPAFQASKRWPISALMHLNSTLSIPTLPSKREESGQVCPSRLAYGIVNGYFSMYDWRAAIATSMEELASMAEHERRLRMEKWGIPYTWWEVSA